MRVPFVDLARANHAVEAELCDAFTRVLDSGRYLMGPEVQRFEDELADWHGVQHAACTASGTDACEIAIRVAGWNTVATPAFGAVPTICAIEAAGATPALVDVDPVTRGVTFDTLATAKADGAIVVHMFGHPCDVPPNAIEDCAHAQGARSKGKLVGTLGLMGALSFFPTKCLGNLGDAGAIITDNLEDDQRARLIRHYGGLSEGDVTGRGQNSRTSEMSAAFLSAKLPHLHDWNKRRREIATRYSFELAGRVTVPVEMPGCVPSYHVYAIEYGGRDRLKAALAERGVETMIHYPRALHYYTRWAHLGMLGQFPVSERLAETVLSLPCFPYMSEAEVDAVVAAVKAET